MPSFKTRLTEDQRWELVLLVRSFSTPSAPSTVGKKADAVRKTAAPATSLEINAIPKQRSFPFTRLPPSLGSVQLQLLSNPEQPECRNF